MKRDELIKELRRIAPKISVPVCLECSRKSVCKSSGCNILTDAALQIQLMDEEIFRLMDRIHELELSKMTPQSAVNILHSANLTGSLRLAADMGIEALEREMGGSNEANRCR